MRNKDREILFKQMFGTLWSEFLQEYFEFGFCEKDLKFEIEVSMKKTTLCFSEKLFKEFFKTFATEKSKIIISKNEKRGIFVFSNNEIIINTKPSLASSMMQNLMFLTRERMEREKRERIIKKKKELVEKAKTILNKEGFDEKRIKTICWYKKGIYYLKINFKKSEKIYFLLEEINEALNDFEYELEVSFVIK